MFLLAFNYGNIITSTTRGEEVIGYLCLFDVLKMILPAFNYGNIITSAARGEEVVPGELFGAPMP